MPPLNQSQYTVKQQQNKTKKLYIIKSIFIKLGKLWEIFILYFLAQISLLFLRKKKSVSTQSKKNVFLRILLIILENKYYYKCMLSLKIPLP